jgi:TolB-like protein/thioredoxin-like negative regulator of GroEL
VSFFAELKRRNVIRVAVLYIISAWLILQVAETLFGLLALPEWAGKLTFALLLLAFPPVLLFSWVFELTPEGLKRQHEVDRAQSITGETGRKLNVAIGALAVIAIGAVVFDRLMPRDAPSERASAGVPADQSIAVLPFVDMSAERDQEYFADGISEELLNLLTKIPSMKVIGRTSSFQFKGKNEDLRVIGQKLNVAHILEGSVRKSGDKIRLTAQLIRAEDGTHLWSETYDRQLDDVFAVQDEIAGEVVKALQVKLLGGAPPTASRTDDPEAHSWYLQGQFFLARRGSGDAKRALEYFERAVERDPKFGAAWAGVSKAAIAVGNTEETDEAVTAAYAKRAQAAALKAIEVEPNLAAGYAALAYHAMTFDWDWDAAARHLARAEALDAKSSDTMRTKATHALNTGDMDTALALYHEMTQREPLASSVFHNYALALRNANRLEEAERAARRALELHPDSLSGVSNLAGIQMLQGNAEAALQTLEKEPDEFWKAATLPLVLIALKRDEEATAATQALIDAHGDVGAYQIASVYAFRGDTERAFEWLERALALRDPGLTEMLGDPFMRSIESDPRYADVVRRVGIRPRS